MSQPSNSPSSNQQYATADYGVANNGYNNGYNNNNNNNNGCNNNNNNELNPHTRRQLGGAAVAGGLAGLVLAGPVLGVVAAGGAALAVTSRGKTGDVARAGGDAMASVGDRLKKINDKHHVVEKTSKGIVKGCNWVSKRVQPRDSGANAAAATGQQYSRS